MTPVAPPNDIPDMHEEALAAGIDHKYTGGWEFFVGGGVAAFDCNGDRKPDLFIAGGTSPAELYRNESPTGGALKFEKVDARPAATPTSRTSLGAYPLDIDNDGIMDLVVLRLGKNLILKGKGDCQFEVANDAFAFDGGKDWTTAFSAEWESRPDVPDAGHRQLRRPHGAGRAVGNLRRQPAHAPASRQRQPQLQHDHRR